MAILKFRTLFLLFISFLMSLVVSELTVRYVVRYPDYGISDFVFGISSNIKWQAQYRPYSRYINTEARGFHPYRRNNLGLPGIDIDTEKDKVLVLGSSFIEAAQVPPANISVSVFAKLLEKSRMSHFTAVNLDRKAHDLYDSWFRYQYYKNLLDYKYVMLIVDQRNSFDRHKQPLDFSLPDGFGETEKRLTKRLSMVALSRSSYLALMFRGFRNLSREQDVDEATASVVDNHGSTYEKERSFIQNVVLCIEKFAQAESSKLIVVSIINDRELNKQVADYCVSKGISCTISDSIQVSENQLHGSGHFNQKGNAELGKLMLRAFRKAQTEQEREI